MAGDRIVSLSDQLPYVSPIQATLQGPTPSIQYEATSEYNEKRYEDRVGFAGFEVRSPVERRYLHGSMTGLGAGVEC